MANWKRVLEAGDLPEGEAREVIVGDEILALFNVAGNLHCLDGICPHQGGPLGKGTLEGSTATCPWHGFQFDVCTGRYQTSTFLIQPHFDIKLEDGGIWIDLDSRE